MNHPLALLSCAAFIFLSVPSASAAESGDGYAGFQISQQGDVEMGCSALSQEALFMRQVVHTTYDIQHESAMRGHGISAAGAAGSLLIGSLTGGIGLAAAGFLMSEVSEEDAEAAEVLQDMALQRRSLMVGIYGAKGCYGPIEHVMQDPAPRDHLLTRVASVAAIEPAAGVEADAHRKTSRYND